MEKKKYIIDKNEFYINSKNDSYLQKIAAKEDSKYMSLYWRYFFNIGFTEAILPKKYTDNNVETKISRKSKKDLWYAYDEIYTQQRTHKHKANIGKYNVFFMWVMIIFALLFLIIGIVEMASCYGVFEYNSVTHAWVYYKDMFNHTTMNAGIGMFVFAFVFVFICLAIFYFTKTVFWFSKRPIYKEMDSVSARRSNDDNILGLKSRDDM